ncbi:MAG: hypothetical protein OXG02_04295 [Chloroflexi bacterium]|nr:hypothetical protein [Chloroflexota bacterium]
MRQDDHDLVANTFKLTLNSYSSNHEDMNRLKWSNQKHWSKFRVTSQLLRQLVDFASEKNLRADVLVWVAKERSRYYQHHKPKESEQVWSLQNMYEQLLVNVIHNRWKREYTSNSIKWSIYTHNPSGIKIDPILWELSSRYLEHIERTQYKLEKLEGKDANKPILLIADILSGMGAYSYLKSSKFLNWLTTRDEPNNTDRYRFQLLEKFYELSRSKDQELIIDRCPQGWNVVGFHTNILRTNQQNINFWPFTYRHNPDGSRVT